VRPLLLALALVTTALGESQYEVVSGWPSLPAGRSLGLCAGVDVDSRGNVFVFHRNERAWSTPFPEEPIAEPTIAVFEGSTGKLLAEWGAGEFVMPHGLTVDRENNVWLTDVGRHQVFKFAHDGKLLLTLGERGRPGADQMHFNLPTDVAVLADGSFYVSDGYRNARVVKFDAKGRYEFEWGGKGAEPGRFDLPHGIALDARGRVFVCDRSNKRVQVFDRAGKFIAEWKGTQVGRPYGVGIAANGHVFTVDGDEPSQAVELDLDGNVIARFGNFRLGHDIAVSRDGAIYVAEGKGKRVQKFIKRTP